MQYKHISCIYKVGVKCEVCAQLKQSLLSGIGDDTLEDTPYTTRRFAVFVLQFSEYSLLHPREGPLETVWWSSESDRSRYAQLEIGSVICTAG